MWKDFETKFGGILERLARHKLYVERCASLAFFKKSRDELADIKTDSQTLHQKHHNDMVDFQTANLAELQDINHNVSQAHNQTVMQFRAQQADFEAHKAADQVHWQKQNEDMTEQNTKSLTRHREYLAEIAQMHSELDELLTLERQKKMKSVKEWLAVGDHVYEDHASYSQVRNEHPSTAKWILGHEVVEDWLRADSPTTPNLWVNGIPGAGTFQVLLYATQVLT